jgi:hypothetical protein
MVGESVSFATSLHPFHFLLASCTTPTTFYSSVQTKKTQRILLPIAFRFASRLVLIGIRRIAKSRLLCCSSLYHALIAQSYPSHYCDQQQQPLVDASQGIAHHNERDGAVVGASSYYHYYLSYYLRTRHEQNEHDQNDMPFMAHSVPHLR